MWERFGRPLRPDAQLEIGQFAARPLVSLPAMRGDSYTHARMYRFSFLFGLYVLTLSAQPRRPEIFGQIGRIRVGGDEGSLGSGTSFGGAVMIPITARWAADIDLQTVRTKSEVSTGEGFSQRTTLLAPAIVRRFGTTRFYGFAGGGIGGQFEQTESRFFAGNPSDLRLVTQSYSDSGAVLLGKLGFVAAVSERLLIRADLALNFRYVLPSVGARIGVGYRF